MKKLLVSLREIFYAVILTYVLLLTGGSVLVSVGFYVEIEKYFNPLFFFLCFSGSLCAFFCQKDWTIGTWTVFVAQKFFNRQKRLGTVNGLESLEFDSMLILTFSIAVLLFSGWIFFIELLFLPLRMLVRKMV